MSLTTAEAPSEMAIFRRIVEQDEPLFSVEAAQAILRLAFSPADRTRMNRLAEKNRRGKLTPVEEEELNNYVRVGQILGILQSKARRAVQLGSRSRDDET